MVTLAVVKVAAKRGPRKVCVRVVDVFGFDAEVVAQVELKDSLLAVRALAVA